MSLVKALALRNKEWFGMIMRSSAHGITNQLDYSYLKDLNAQMFVQVGYVHAQLRARGCFCSCGGKGVKRDQNRHPILNSSTRKCIEVTNTRRRSLLKIRWMEVSSP